MATIFSLSPLLRSFFCRDCVTRAIGTENLVQRTSAREKNIFTLLTHFTSSCRRRKETRLAFSLSRYDDLLAHKRFFLFRFMFFVLAFAASRMSWKNAFNAE